MLKCEDVQNELEAFLSNELDKAQKTKIQDHLKECQNCSLSLKKSARLAEVLQSWQDIEPPPQMYEKLQTRIKSLETLRGKIFLNPVLLCGGLTIALLSSALPFTLEYEALKRVSPRTFGILLSTEPAIAVLVGIVLLGQQLDLRTFIAVTCVTIAAIGVTFSET